MIKFLTKNHMSTKGYAYCFYFNLPEFILKCKTHHITGGNHTHTTLSLPTYFLLTRNSIYYNMSISILGFGMGFEIQTRS